MAQTTVKLPFKKETKNMLQYQCSDDEKNNFAVPTLYVRKDVLPNPFPEFIEITVKGVNK